MTFVHKEWMDSEYITKDESGWHCSRKAPEEIQNEFDKFMEEINSGGIEIVNPQTSK